MSNKLFWILFIPPLLGGITLIASLDKVYTLWIGEALLGLAFVVLVIRLITWKRRKGKVAPKREEVQPEISIEIDKCSRGNSVIRYGQPEQTIEVAFTLKVNSPPINVADLQLYLGDEKLILISPTVPFTQENSKGCYVAKYELSLGTILKVPKDSTNNYRLCVVAMGQKWYSEVFSMHIPKQV